MMVKMGEGAGQILAVQHGYEDDEGEKGEDERC